MSPEVQIENEQFRAEAVELFHGFAGRGADLDVRRMQAPIEHGRDDDLHLVVVLHHQNARRRAPAARASLRAAQVRRWPLSLQARELFPGALCIHPLAVHVFLVASNLLFVPRNAQVLMPRQHQQSAHQDEEKGRVAALVAHQRDDVVE